MPALKADIKIDIRVGEKSFSIGGVMLPDHRFMIKCGRSVSKKRPTATLTQIFTEARKWAVRNSQKRI